MLRVSRRTFVAAGTVGLVASQMQDDLFAQPPTGLSCLGMVSIKNTKFGRYLQSYSGNKDGEIHCSNDGRHEEETWFLWRVDQANHIYAFQNWRNQKFLATRGDGCVKALNVGLDASAKWKLVSGVPFGINNAYAFCSVATGHYLGTNGPGDDSRCGGEVSCGLGANQPVAPGANDPTYPGWWVITGEEKPTPGDKSFGEILGIAVEVVKVAATVIAAL